MLVQSQADEVQLLPALPQEWQEGHVRGLKARGGFEITDMQWQGGKIVKLSIRSLTGGMCHLRVPNALTGAKLPKANGTDKAWTYELKTQPGGVYNFNGK